MCLYVSNPTSDNFSRASEENIGINEDEDEDDFEDDDQKNGRLTAKDVT